MPTLRQSKSECQKIIRLVEECISEGYVPYGTPSAIREAARRLGAPYATLHGQMDAAKRFHGLVPRSVNDLPRKKAQGRLRPESRRIIAWDIETLPILAAVWGTGEQIIHSNQIIEQTSIACASWQDIATDRINTVSVLDDPKRFERDPYDDKAVVTALHKMLNQIAESGDILLHQNGDQFDLPKVKARIVYHRLPSLPPLQTVDTVKASKQAGKFDSNRLGFIDEHVVGGPGKVANRGMDMWTEACAPKSPHSKRVQAMREMVRYNRGDLPPLIGRYRLFLPYMTRHPNRAIGSGECCPRCGGKGRDHIGFNDKLTRRYPTYRCHSCHGIFESLNCVARAWFKAA